MLLSLLGDFLRHAALKAGGTTAINLAFIIVLKWVAEHGGQEGLNAWIAATFAKERAAATTKIATGIELSRGTESEKARGAGDLSVGIAEMNQISAKERRYLRALSLGLPSYIVMWIATGVMFFAGFAGNHPYFVAGAGVWIVSLILLIACVAMIGRHAYMRGSPPETTKAPLPERMRIDMNTPSGAQSVAPAEVDSNRASAEHLTKR